MCILNPSYTVVFSARKNISLEMTRSCTVLVRAPIGVPESELDRVVLSHTNWIDKHLAQARLRQAAHPEPTPAEVQCYIQQAKDLLPKRVAQFGAQIGLMPTGITITGARTRFGSCSSKNRLSFSWRLLQYPPEAIDYVVVHELAHVRYKNHGSAFWACVASIFPDWKRRRAMLKQ